MAVPRGRWVRWLVRAYILAMVWFVVLLEVLGLLVRLDRTVTAPGRIVARTEANLFAPLDGKVAEVMVRNNQRVKFGTPILKYDVSSTRARLDVMRHEAIGHHETITRMQEEMRAIETQGACKLDEVRATSPEGELARVVSEQEALVAQWDTRLAEAQLELAVSRLEQRRIERELERRAKLAGVSVARVELDALQDALDVAVSRVSLEEARTTRAEADRRVALEAHTTRHRRLAQDLERHRRELARIEAEGQLERERIATRIQTLSREATDIQLRIAAEEEVLGKAEVRAPWDATILVEVEPGIVVSRGAVLFRLVMANDLRFRADVPEGTLVDVQPGQTAVIKLDAFPHMRYGTWSGHVHELSSQLTRDGEPASLRATLQVDVVLAAPRAPASGGSGVSGELLPNLSGTAEITVERDVPFLVLLVRQLYGR